MLSGCAGANAVGAGLGMYPVGAAPLGLGEGPLPIYAAPAMRTCTMQQDPIGGISGPTLRMNCY